MTGYRELTYGERIADVYDGLPIVPSDADHAVAFLAPLANEGTALELGIGSGRIALPLAQRGLRVHGIDASEAMLLKLRAKPGGASIPVTVGNFADVAVDGKFSVIFTVFSTFFGLLSQDDQVRCFRNVARHLTARGAFVIEAFVPDPDRFDRGQRVDAVSVDAESVHLHVTRHDPVRQYSVVQHVLIEQGKVRLYPVQIRYAWPSELDLMARLAGMSLRQRWGGWRCEPFRASSGQHVSVYGPGDRTGS